MEVKRCIVIRFLQYESSGGFIVIISKCLFRPCEPSPNPVSLSFGCGGLIECIKPYRSMVLVAIQSQEHYQVGRAWGCWETSHVLCDTFSDNEVSPGHSVSGAENVPLLLTSFQIFIHLGRCFFHVYMTLTYFQHLWKIYM